MATELSSDDVSTVFDYLGGKQPMGRPRLSVTSSTGTGGPAVSPVTGATPPPSLSPAQFATMVTNAQRNQSPPDASLPQGGDGASGVGEGPGVQSDVSGALSPPGAQGALGPFGYSAGPMGARGEIGPVGVNVSPFGGIGVSARTGNPTLDFAMNLAQSAAKVPLSMNLMSLIAPALAPFGSMAMAPGLAVGIGKIASSIMGLAGKDSVEATLQSVSQGLRSSSESVRDSAQASVNAANEGLAQLAATGQFFTSDPAVANLMAAAGAKAFAFAGGHQFSAHLTGPRAVNAGEDPDTSNAPSATGIPGVPGVSVSGPPGPGGIGTGDAGAPGGPGGSPGGGSAPGVGEAP